MSQNPKNEPEKLNENSNILGRLLSDLQEDRLNTCFICDFCKEPIKSPQDGFIIHGNIYSADTSCVGGLIGNNFPDKLIDQNSVKRTVLCRHCLMKALKLFEV